MNTEFDIQHTTTLRIGQPQYFILADPAPEDVLQALQKAREVWDPDKYQVNVRAMHAGMLRAPKKGEWYLSGAYIVAYQAPNDLTTVHQMARLVLVREEPAVERTILKTFPRPAP
jgi:hypothetical protein